MRWLNDYGDVPWWYRGPAFRRPCPRHHRHAARRALALVMAIASL